MFLWDKDTGNYWIVSWSGYNPYLRTPASCRRPGTRCTPADLDGNGLVNELLVFDRETGKYAVYSWQGYQRSCGPSGTSPRGRPADRRRLERRW